jgi:hypothetical protein
MDDTELLDRLIDRKPVLAPPKAVIRKPRRARSEATDDVIAQFAEAQRELDARAALQLRNRDKWHDSRLARYWADFPEGIGLVMRAAETARGSHLYRKGAPFLLTQPEIEGLMIRSKGRCELSGVPFSGEAVVGCHKRPFVPSIDRIKPKEAYTYSNTRLVCWAVNLALGEWGDEVFWRIVRTAAAKG